MFGELQTAIENITREGADIETALDALTIDYIRSEKLYPQSIQLWYQVTDKTLTDADMPALMSLLARLLLVAKLTHNKRFLLLTIVIEY